MVVFLGALITSKMEASPSSETARVAYLKGVEVIAKGSRPGEVWVAYQQACGESLKGVVLNETKSLLMVGALVDRTETVCLSLPERRELVVPILTKRPVASFPLRESKRIILSEVGEITLGDGTISVSYQDSCRPLMGVVFSPLFDQNLRPSVGLSLATLPKESPRSMIDGGGCRKEFRRKSIRGVKLPSELVQVNRKPGSVKDLYALRIIAPKSFQLSRNGGLSITWEKSCREEAVGLLFTGRDGRDVAVLSAYAPNVPCVGAKKTTVSYELNHLTVAEGQTIKPLSAEEARTIGRSLSYSYRLQSLNSIKLASAGDASWLLASPAAACGQRLGLVVGQDENSNVSMAALADGGSRVCQVAGSKTSETLTAPLVGPAEGPLPKVFALKIFGTLVD